eukprot:m.156443 g.156443  ORF g.156443 m.156443 type:complete len:630 (+) comp16988_c0_seq1:626-2515(+)
MSSNEQLIKEYMTKLSGVMSSSEILELTTLIRQYRNEITINEFCAKLVLLYGEENKALLPGLLPFIRVDDKDAFNAMITQQFAPPSRVKSSVAQALFSQSPLCIRVFGLKNLPVPKANLSVAVLAGIVKDHRLLCATQATGTVPFTPKPCWNAILTFEMDDSAVPDQAVLSFCVYSIPTKRSSGGDRVAKSLYTACVEISSFTEPGFKEIPLRKSNDNATVELDLRLDPQTPRSDGPTIVLGWKLPIQSKDSTTRASDMLGNDMSPMREQAFSEYDVPEQDGGMPGSPRSVIRQLVRTTLVRSYPEELLGLALYPRTTGTYVKAIVNGSPADRCGQIRPEDKLYQIGSTDISKFNHTRVLALLRTCLDMHTELSFLRTLDQPKILSPLRASSGSPLPSDETVSTPVARSSSMRDSREPSPPAIFSPREGSATSLTSSLLGAGSHTTAGAGANNTTSNNYPISTAAANSSTATSNYNYGTPSRRDTDISIAPVLSPIPSRASSAASSTSTATTATTATSSSQQRRQQPAITTTSPPAAITSNTPSSSSLLYGSSSSLNDSFIHKSVNVCEITVEQWLQNLKLSEYFPMFQEHGFDEQVLPYLNEDDLDLLGVKTAGHRKKLLIAAKKLVS